MKRILGIILVLVLCTGLWTGASAATTTKTEISVLLNGEKILFDVEPIIENGRTLVPLRAIFEALDMTVSYDNGKISAEKEGLTISLTVDSDIAYINGEQKVLDVSSKIVDNRTIVPVRFIGEATGLVVDYDNTTKTVTMNDGVKTLEPKAHDLKSDWDEAEATKITLNGSSATVEGSGAKADGGVITISDAGTYVISGTLTNGQIVVSATKEDRVRVILNGVDITNKTGAAIYASQCDKLILTLAEGTKNTVTDGGANYVYSLKEEEEPNAAIFSKDDLTINGTGSLTVNAGFNNGIGTKDDLLIISGNLTVNAANHGLRGNDSVGIVSGNFNITAGNDGIQTNNDTEQDKGWIVIEGGTFEINAVFDGIQAENDLTITGGVFNITTGGGSANAEMSSNKFGDPDTTTGMTDGGGWQMGGERGQMQGGIDMATMQSAMEIIRGAGESELTEEQLQALRDLGLTDVQIEQFKTMTQGGGMGTGGQRPQGDFPGQTQEATEEENSDSLKALKAETLITITGGEFTIDAEDDSVHSNGDIFITGGKFSIKTGDDAIHGDNNVKIAAGEINISLCYEGIEGQTITVSGGNITIVATDDGINASDGTGTTTMGGGARVNENLFIRIIGGELGIVASGDGIDSNGNLYIEGGTVKISGHSMVAEGAIDADGDIVVTGGEVITAGSWEEVSKKSTQPVLLLSYTDQQPSGSVIMVKDSKGNILLEYTSKNAYTMSGFTSPYFEVGGTYSLFIDGQKLTDVTLSGTVTSINDDGGAYSGNSGFGGVGGRGGMSGGQPPTNSQIS